ncbi:hypothetical protein HR060_01875 [Catenovulum sp. SM1970]|uniref:sensor histidine kinase n=1 Tax=Marinifaba aquimaris TaxID=2741323 RepID=UPI0015729C35|nr:histidine kinase [Marinifaba aquimaris]NTS75602.1 hypothetical protein [Marinifaba aquimaris]
MNKEELTLVLSGVFSWLVVFLLDHAIWASSSYHAFLYICFLAIFLWFSYARFNPAHLSGLRGGLLIQGICCLILMIPLNPEGITPILLVIWAAVLPEVYKTRQAALVLIGINTVYIFAIIFGSLQTEHIMKFISFLVFEVFAFASTTSRIRERSHRAELQKKHSELLAMRSVLDQRHQMEERLRISKELHNHVGTKLTALSLRVEQAKQAPQQDYVENLDLIKTEIRKTTQDLKAAVTQLRDSSQRDLKEMIDALVANIPTIEVNVPEPVVLSDSELTEKLFFCLHDAINNAIEFGQATRFTLTLEDATPLTLKLSNNGRVTNDDVNSACVDSVLKNMNPFVSTATILPNTRQQGMSLFLKLDEQF